MDIRAIVNSMVKKYETRSPYELADLLHIQVSRCELGSIRGYYLKKYRIQQIILNCNLDYNEEKYVLAHELGHAILHPNMNTPFLKNNTLLSTDKFEREANKFAVELLIPHEVILQHCDFTESQLARLTGYSEELIKLRLQ